jgi:hypothetical protein
MNTVLGVRVAQVRIIFTLPRQFQVGMYSRALAYVEWFTPLREPELSSGLRQVSRSTRQLHRNAAVTVGLPPIHFFFTHCITSRSLIAVAR